jgi:2-polyprenyl-6-hydroxyphenyl methylase/3-demethylubiquinone-9 3-methyltransferase
MPESQQAEKDAQAAIFSSYDWWNQHCLLLRINEQRCAYVEAGVDRVFGKGALKQQEVLDIGCGGGLICENLAQRGATVMGIDPSAEALRMAREHVIKSGLGHNAWFVQGYAESLPFSDGSFSVITCLDTLEHVRDLQATICEIARVLAPGGVFVFDTINRTFLARLALIWFGERFFHRGGLLPGLHKYQDFIKPEELRAALTTSGLNVSELKGFMPQISKGRLTLAPGWFTGVSYIGYATKGR